MFEGEAEAFGFLLEDGDVALVETAEEECAAGVEDGDVGSHIIQFQVAKIQKKYYIQLKNKKKCSI